jgi:hypothetical protein
VRIVIIETFKPYLPGRGPIFHLAILDTGVIAEYGKHVYSYRLDQIEPNGKRTPLFQGHDYCAHAWPREALIADLMGFLTLKPGDTDDDYFAKYTETQRRYCAEHAETLSAEVSARFPEG